ncbi:MAG: hypothetical protein EPN93_15470 [Spirochaetes bacterium]|nr:MAG: hypothetical protein EPN93_15470 [Spirochaetota bacterium]
MKKCIAAGVALACCVVFSACGKAGKPGEITGTITIAVGEVTVNGKLAKANDTVKFGDVIETKKDAKCRIIVDGQNVIETWKESLLVFKLTQGDGLLELKSGSMGALLKNLKKVKEFRVTTQTVAAGIRGTAFCINAETPDKTYTCTCNGKVAYKAEGQGKETVISAAHHKAAYYERVDGKIKDKEAGMLYHTDAKMEELASSIGVKIDWGKAE